MSWKESLKIWTTTAAQRQVAGKLETSLADSSNGTLRKIPKRHSQCQNMTSHPSTRKHTEYQIVKLIQNPRHYHIQPISAINFGLSVKISALNSVKKKGDVY